MTLVVLWVKASSKSNRFNENRKKHTAQFILKPLPLPLRNFDCRHPSTAAYWFRYHSLGTSFVVIFVVDVHPSRTRFFYAHLLKNKNVQALRYIIIFNR